jgi:DNA-binding GntR family transcriptional regulator/AcrR family transcriptional regulator
VLLIENPHTLILMDTLYGQGMVIANGYLECSPWSAGMRPIDHHARLTHHVGQATELRGKDVTKRKGSAVRLVRSDGRRAALDVYEALRDSILAGRIKPGAYLSQVEVARELGVSRTPVREALRRLHESGLIAGEPNFRSRVLGLDPEEIESIYIKRVILEGFSVLCTATGASGAQLRDLRSGLTQLQDHIDGPAASWTRARLNLHSLLLVGANISIRRELSTLQERCLQLEQTAEKNRDAGSRRSDAASYKGMVDAVARADAEQASRLLLQVLDGHTRSVLHSLAPAHVLHGFRKAVTFMSIYATRDQESFEESEVSASGTVLGHIDPGLSAYLPSEGDVGGDPVNTVVRGRPRDGSKRESILAAAHVLFLKYGPDAITMNRLADEANVAKATLYANFDDKDAVLEAWVRRESELMVSDSWKSDHRDVSLEDSLIDFGQHMLTFLANPQHLGLERLVFGIASRDRELGERLFLAGPARVLEILKSMLRDGQASGELSISNIDEATDDLVGLWQGFLPVDLSFHQPPDPKAAYLRARAARGVNQFMRLYSCNPRRSKAPR